MKKLRFDMTMAVSSAIDRICKEFQEGVLVGVLYFTGTAVLVGVLYFTGTAVLVGADEYCRCRCISQV